ncbi:MAG: dCMP deaminase family protein [Firmicutes bacterium]|nr:dCMP deaminase family protein [Bacillota bacterium]
MNVGTEKWDARFMDVAALVAEWSSCIREGRQVGCVITKNKRVLTTGYNGASSGIKTCAERGGCLRQIENIPSGKQHEYCYAAHAEQNALIQAARLGVSVEGATLYCTHRPCAICAKLIINAGIARVVYRYDYPDDFASRMLAEAGISTYQFNGET